ncbi:hypothetical protein HPG69_010800 [Diceros bicornis minor]|uniref:Uncharacterized protein n=1 Tax=Diceros bicornis minor TaxID=77932 RepID=A0A7J7EGT4_DICBM|nr:hypothetical protein HPG69_010800 [Diceros bicornis minor]
MWSPATSGPALGLMRAWPIHNDASETLPEPLHPPTDVTPEPAAEDVRGEHSDTGPTSLSGVILSALGPKNSSTCCLLLLLLPGEPEHGCRLWEEVEKAAS